MPRRELNRSQMLSQFFTNPKVAKKVLDITQDVLEERGKSWKQLYFVECAAGDGSFTDLLPEKRTVGVEVDPALLKKHPEFLKADLKKGGFLGLDSRDLGLDRVAPSNIVVGFNPPFSIPRLNGRSHNVAMDFVNHAASIGDTVAMILPNTFRRPATQNKVDKRLHLIYDMDLPSNSFTMDGEEAKVTTVFQIWQAQYDKKGRPIIRPEDKMLKIVKGGEWGGDFRFVKSTDPKANVRICNWGSHETVGRLDGPKDTKCLVSDNQRKVRQRERDGKSMKGFEPDNSHYYLVADDPKKTMKKFSDRKYLFEELAQDRTSGNNPDLTVGDMVRIYTSPLGTHYVQGRWLSDT
jgi:hypothetical protein